MTISKILVCTDLSEGADVALTNALNVGRHTGAEVVVLHVGEWPAAPVGFPERDEWDEVIRRSDAAVRAELAELCARHASSGVAISHRILEGVPHAAIIAAADELGADLVVVGTHGRTGFQRFLLGSVAERVLRHAHTHVMLARPGHGGAHGFRRVLVPTDFSESAERALELALELTGDDGSVELLHCWSMPASASMTWSGMGVSRELTESLARAIRDGARRRLDALVARHRDPVRPVRLLAAMEEAAPRVGIQQRLMSTEYDLVALGSRSRRGLAQCLIGRVAEATARHAECSVIVARESR